MKICICGDSFSYDSKGWPRLLNAKITNHSQNGVGEYKIYKQIFDLDQTFDYIIVCHTSPWRLHTLHHPIHSNNPERPANDFMLNDLAFYKSKSNEVEKIYNHIQSYTDWDYVKNIYDMLVEKTLLIKNTIHLTFHHPDDTNMIPNNYYDVWQKFPGNVNHLNMTGNEIVAKRIKKLLQ